MKISLSDAELKLERVSSPDDLLELLQDIVMSKLQATHRLADIEQLVEEEEDYIASMKLIHEDVQTLLVNWDPDK